MIVLQPVTTVIFLFIFNFGIQSFGHSYLRIDESYITMYSLKKFARMFLVKTFYDVLNACSMILMPKSDVVCK